MPTVVAVRGRAYALMGTTTSSMWSSPGASKSWEKRAGSISNCATSIARSDGGSAAPPAANAAYNRAVRARSLESRRNAGCASATSSDGVVVQRISRMKPFDQVTRASPSSERETFDWYSAVCCFVAADAPADSW